MGLKLDQYNAIITAIKGITTAGKRDINHVGLWNNQPDHENDQIPVNYPAVYIEFASIPWNTTNLKSPNLGATGNIIKEQKSDIVVIVLHCVFAPLSDVDISFPEIEPILEKIYFAIQGLESLCAQPLLRSAERQDPDHDRVLDWQMDFVSSYQQAGEEDSTLTLIGADVLTIETTKDLDIEPTTSGDIRTGPE